ncbi:MAG: hypothetical protein R6V85_01460 [Polyangia bacterium]
MIVLDASAPARHPHDVLLPGIWKLRNRMTAHDAAYTVLWPRRSKRGC